MVAKGDESPVGEQDRLILNLTASVGVLSALLCALSAHGVGAHRVGVITQVPTLFALDIEVVVPIVEHQIRRADRRQQVSYDVHCLRYIYSPAHGGWIL